MRKIVAVLLFVAMTQGSALAAQRGTPEYEKLKELKKTERAQKASEKAAAGSSSGTGSFWQRETERSGLAGTGAMVGNSISGFFSSLGSMHKPKSK